MGSSFEDLIATRLAVKADLDLDARFERYFIFRIQIHGKKRKITLPPSPQPPLVAQGRIKESE